MIFKKINNYVFFLLLKNTANLLKIFGKKNSSTFSSFIFCIFGPLTKYHSRAKVNIKYVWPHLNNNKIEKILSKMWSNIGRNFGEFFFLRGYNPLEDKNTKIYGREIVDKVLTYSKTKKKGVIFFSAHYGNWELAPIVLATLGFEVLTIYRKSNNNYINNLIQSVRETFATYTPKGDLGAKKSFFWLRKGKCLALAMDQKLNEGNIVKLLGKNSFTASAIAELAIRMDLDIVPIRILREDFFNKIKFYDKLKKPKKKLCHEKKVFFILNQVNNLLTEWITDKPEQWYWIHRRWEKYLYDDS